jgi:hypothetical protein
MKKIITLAVLLSLLSVTDAVFAQRIDAATWRNVETFDVVTLKPIQEMQIGKLVRVRFNYRSKKIRHIKPNWYEASLWQPNPQERTGYSYVRVFIAKKDLPDFESLPDNFKSREKLVVYGRVSKDAEANYVFIRLLGRKAILDPGGDAVIVW